jgi:hypothetical protein
MKTEKEITIKDLKLDYRQWTDILDCIETALCRAYNGHRVLSAPCTDAEQAKIIQEYYDWIKTAIDNTEFE